MWCLVVAEGAQWHSRVTLGLVRAAHKLHVTARSIVPSTHYPVVVVVVVRSGPVIYVGAAAEGLGVGGCSSHTIPCAHRCLPFPAGFLAWSRMRLLRAHLRMC